MIFLICSIFFKYKYLIIILLKEIIFDFDFLFEFAFKLFDKALSIDKTYANANKNKGNALNCKIR